MQPNDPPVKDHLERDVQTLCAYCGRSFELEEVVIEKEINGRTWKFCRDECYRDFMEALHFQDEDLDSYETGMEVHVGGPEEK